MDNIKNGFVKYSIAKQIRIKLLFANSCCCLFSLLIILINAYLILNFHKIGLLSIIDTKNQNRIYGSSLLNDLESLQLHISNQQKMKYILSLYNNINDDNTYVDNLNWTSIWNENKETNRFSVDGSVNKSVCIINIFIRSLNTTRQRFNENNFNFDNIYLKINNNQYSIIHNNEDIPNFSYSNRSIDIYSNVNNTYYYNTDNKNNISIIGQSKNSYFNTYFQEVSKNLRYIYFNLYFKISDSVNNNIYIYTNTTCEKLSKLDNKDSNISFTDRNITSCFSFINTKDFFKENIFNQLYENKEIDYDGGISPFNINPYFRYYHFTHPRQLSSSFYKNDNDYLFVSSILYDYNKLYSNYNDFDDIFTNSLMLIFLISYMIWVFEFIIIIIVVNRVSISISSPINLLIYHVTNIGNDDDNEKIKELSSLDDLDYPYDSDIRELFIICKSLIQGGLININKTKLNIKSIPSENYVYKVKCSNILINNDILSEHLQEHGSNIFSYEGNFKLKDKIKKEINNINYNDDLYLYIRKRDNIYKRESIDYHKTSLIFMKKNISKEIPVVNNGNIKKFEKVDNLNYIIDILRDLDHKRKVKESKQIKINSEYNIIDLFESLKLKEFTD